MRNPILSFTVSKRKGSISCLLSQHEKTDLLQKVWVFSPVLILQPPAGQCFVVMRSLLTNRTENSLSAGKNLTILNSMLSYNIPGTQIVKNRAASCVFKKILLWCLSSSHWSSYSFLTRANVLQKFPFLLLLWHYLALPVQPFKVSRKVYWPLYLQTEQISASQWWRAASFNLYLNTQISIWLFRFLFKLQAWKFLLYYYIGVCWYNLEFSVDCNIAIRY